MKLLMKFLVIVITIVQYIIINNINKDSIEECLYIQASQPDNNNKPTINAFRLSCISCKGDFSNFIKASQQTKTNLLIYLINYIHR